MLTLGQTPSIPVVSKVSTIILGMGTLFGFLEQSDVPSIAAMVSSRRWPLISSYGASGRTQDGVSESQVNQILIKLLTLASSLTRSGTLKIVVIVVRKIIIPSFFNKDLLTMCYMTHYHVLLDQAGFSADDLWGQFMKFWDASETSSSHGGMYAPGVISVPQLSRLKDKVNNFIHVC
ncbi:hypothetical protein CXB51_013672 [Gossypium anomalum]|uniref:Uncharacterized protein n=1 Tax=Gossypium anomalum TaxID=47600 RepID=A0A8J5ZKF3_9ROSI|nr:hypothetical protein CXB51_013672 [Gossypium anomalum]